jgi:hypothetical protein
MYMFSSKGIKRFIATQLLLLITLIQMSGITVLYVLIPPLQALAAALGGAGIVHAAGSGALRLLGDSPLLASSESIKTYILSTIGAVIAIANFIPFMAPYRELLQEIGALIAAALAGSALESKKTA